MSPLAVVLSHVIRRPGLATGVTGGAKRGSVGVGPRIEGRREVSPVIFWRVKRGEK
jgi:hypothetical protein